MKYYFLVVFALAALAALLAFGTRHLFNRRVLAAPPTEEPALPFVVRLATEPGPLAVKPYYVTSAAAFPAVPIPARALVFRNGLFMSPGLDYDAAASLRFRAGVLSDGDRIAVVTLP